MTITFDNENDVLVFALEKIIAYPRGNQYIFLAQSAWWISSIIGLQQELINHIDNLQDQIHTPHREVSTTPRDIQGGSELQNDLRKNHSDSSTKESEGSCSVRRERILQNCEKFVKTSQWQRRIALLKATGKSKTGHINPSKITKKSLRSHGNKSHKEIEGICDKEIRGRRSEGECLRCAWPSNGKGAHHAKDCRRSVKLDKGTASFPTYKKHQHPVQESSSEEGSSDNQFG